MNQPQDRYKNFFEKLGNTMPYLKMAAEGQAGSGKTFTLALVAAGLHGRIGSKKPIVIFDTEKSAKFLRHLFHDAGIDVLVKQSRTLPDLVESIKFCDEGNSDVLLIDSITHVWEDYLAAYQAKKGRKFIQFQDWAEIKPTWKREFSSRIVDAKCHIFFTGRQGFTYDYEEINGKKELVKTGVKMKAEAETAYEPDLLILMERFEKLLGEDKEVWREATVLKGRSQLLDGKTFANPKYSDFAPEVEYLLADPTERTETTSLPNEMLIDDAEGESSDRKERKIYLERSNTLLDEVAAGTSGAAKSLRISLLKYAYEGETSETAIEAMNLGQLKYSFDKLSTFVAEIRKALRGERALFSTEKAALDIRRAQLQTENFGDVALDQMKDYIKYLADRYRGTAPEIKGVPDVAPKATGPHPDLDAMREAIRKMSEEIERISMTAKQPRAGKATQWLESPYNANDPKQVQQTYESARAILVEDGTNATD